MTGDVGWLDAAGGLLDVALTHFADGTGGFFDSMAATDDGVPLLRRPQDPTDNATPSGASAVGAALVSYAALTGRRLPRGRRDGAGEGRTGARRAPAVRRGAAAVAEAMMAGPFEIAVVGRPDLERLARLSPSPGAVVVTAGPLAEGRPERALYICHHFTCERPLTDLAEVAERLGVRPST